MIFPLTNCLHSEDWWICEAPLSKQMCIHFRCEKRLLKKASNEWFVHWQTVCIAKIGEYVKLPYQNKIMCIHGNTKKRGNKKSGESITPIRYNVIHMYVHVVFHAIWWFSKANPSNLSHWWLGNVQFLHTVHCNLGTIMIIDCSFCAS